MNVREFTEFSRYTDPGEFSALLHDLPTSLEGIGDIIHAQLIHPGRARELVTQVNEKDEESCETVSSILARLQERNPIGLSLARKPEHRVVNNCCGHSQLMAAILKGQGVPARLRCGFSLYPFDGFSCDHTVLEAWIDGEWRLIDPSDPSKGKVFRLYESPTEVFHFGWQAWQRVTQGIDSKDRYCVSPGLHPGVDEWEFLRGALVRDLACLFGHEIQCWHCPPFRDIADDELRGRLDVISDLMASPDDNRDDLEEFCNLLEFSR